MQSYLMSCHAMYIHTVECIHTYFAYTNKYTNLISWEPARNIRKNVGNESMSLEPWQVCILVAGPDFPTSMLCGIAALSHAVRSFCNVLLTSWNVQNGSPFLFLGGSWPSTFGSPNEFTDTFAQIYTWGGILKLQIPQMLLGTTPVIFAMTSSYGSPLSLPVGRKYENGRNGNNRK